MNEQRFSRRKMLSGLGVTAGMALLPGQLISQALVSSPPPPSSFSFCLNTSTIMGQKVGLVREIEIAAEAGYDGIEIWIRSLREYVAAGGSLVDLKRRIDDLGIRVEDSIGFAQWIVDDHDVRMRALEQAKEEMDLLAQIGCRRIAAPPAGATAYGGLDLDKAAERFRALVELGKSMEVLPQLEIWGFSKNLHKLSQVLYVAAECGHPDTRILPDVYHLYKGGSDFDGLKLLSGQTVEIFHMNDYPDKPGREEIQDKDRVYPGLGVGPVTEVLRDLKAAGGPTVLSLELFNRDYWAEDALSVAKRGLQSMKEAVAKV
ncbi:MAG: sugar phosphate isomerase/epimerase family protein [Bacteroidota bacterium]